jgi:hypothetical protein
MRGLLLLVLLAAGNLAAAAEAYDASGVALGGSERDVKMRFPSAHCRPLEWSSPAADRRCDDSRISFGGVAAYVTFYLKKDAIQAFDLRFDTRDLKRVVAQLKESYGDPLTETKDRIEREGDDPRVVYRALWEQGRDRALLVAPLEKRRSRLTASRGNFEEEIYRIR